MENLINTIFLSALDYYLNKNNNKIQNYLGTLIFVLKRFILFWVTKMEKDLNLMKTMRCCGHILYHHFIINEAQNKLVFLLYRHGEMNQNDLVTCSHHL